MAIKYRAHIHQLTALRSKKALIALFGGVGSGKTDCGSLWTLGKVKAQLPDQLGLIAANSYSQLKDSTLRNFYKNMRKWGVKLRPAEVPKANGPFSIEIWNGRAWVEVLCRSLDNYDSLAGVELNWAWSDETYATSYEALSLVIDRLRDEQNGVPTQLLMTTTLDEPGSAQYKLFKVGYDPEIMEVIYATTYANAANLPDGYIDRMKRFNTEAMFRRKVLCQWVNLEGSNIYYNFKDDRNVTELAEFRPDLTIRWSHDFNIGEGKPMSSILAHIIPPTAPDDPMTVHVFDEIVLESADTNEACDEFENRPWLRRQKKPLDVVVYGDAAGKYRDTRSKKTDYKIIGERGFNKQRVPAKNPPIRSRHNVVNIMLKSADGTVRVFIHPRCKTLIDGLTNTHLKPGANYIEAETFSQHITTALGYFLEKEFGFEIEQAQQRPLTGS